MPPLRKNNQIDRLIAMGATATVRLASEPTAAPIPALTRAINATTPTVDTQYRPCGRRRPVATPINRMTAATSKATN